MYFSFNHFRYTTSLTADMNENQQPMVMMTSLPPNSEGHGMTYNSSQATPVTSNVHYLPETLSQPVKTPFMRDVAQRNSRNYHIQTMTPTQNMNPGRFLTRTEANVANHYFNYHQNLHHPLVLCCILFPSSLS